MIHISSYGLLLRSISFAFMTNGSVKGQGVGGSLVDSQEEFVISFSPLSSAHKFVALDVAVGSYSQYDS
jgi:hypothetical protein